MISYRSSLCCIFEDLTYSDLFCIFIATMDRFQEAGRYRNIEMFQIWHLSLVVVLSVLQKDIWSILVFPTKYLNLGSVYLG
ncbi:hypothetical protein JRO89_XS14G0052300 [Xanthoceras sorbifolium]|uniref:Uncharacterized protein n=1 Tax=Xanthoceras sorbifolium TaxID=99658 RepID=A0ABQ8H3X3_9ROSI|nr:hypothetical protein JRO89_XS14G0052300 [Xanthoceras sorbifolium]